MRVQYLASQESCMQRPLVIVGNSEDFSPGRLIWNGPGPQGCYCGCSIECAHLWTLPDIWCQSLFPGGDHPFCMGYTLPCTSGVLSLCAGSSICWCWILCSNGRPMCTAHLGLVATAGGHFRGGLFDREERHLQRVSCCYSSRGQCHLYRWWRRVAQVHCLVGLHLQLHTSLTLLRQ